MKTWRLLLSMLLTVVALAALGWLLHADAVAVQTPPPPVSTEAGGAPTTGVLSADELIGIRSVGESSVTTEQCYKADKTQELCFQVHNGSTDFEWLRSVRVTFPSGTSYPWTSWTASCKQQDATDSTGNPVHFSCDGASVQHQVVYTDTDFDGYGEIAPGASWGFCVDVAVPTDYSGDRWVHWGVQGDKYGGEPHEVTGSFLMEQCTPLMLKPSSREAEGCNGVPQHHVFELWNDTGSGGTFRLSYEVPSGNASFGGADEFVLGDGEILTFTTILTPDQSLTAGDRVTATLRVSGNGKEDSSDIYKTVSETGGWEMRPASPVATMDNVVVWARHDGGLWSIGGFGSKGATQRYDLGSQTWTTHAVEMSPTIEYPMDGCYGRDGDDHEVVVLFPDTIVTPTIHRYDITADEWETDTIPTPFNEGRWGMDIVSLYNNPTAGYENICYLSGGSTETGGGRVKNLFAYYPATNTINYLGNYTHIITGFNFHASWFVPWIGSGDGAICVAGGVDFHAGVTADTECYDIAKHEFREKNVDLGPLPEPWWGMADGWRMRLGRYQIWLANGVAQNGTLLPVSAYADEFSGGFHYGPALPKGLYRLEGDGASGVFYAEQGAAGGFLYSGNNLVMQECPLCHVYLPVTLRDHSG
jgi:hypothetical protein